MNEFKSVAFSGVEKQIRDARLIRSAMIGEAIGNTFAAVGLARSAWVHG